MVVVDLDFVVLLIEHQALWSTMKKKEETKEHGSCEFGQYLAEERKEKKSGETGGIGYLRRRGWEWAEAHPRCAAVLHGD